MELEYAGGDKLFMPVERLNLIQKYSGGEHARRSIASAARPGRRPRRASRRRCATWPTSCSSSTLSARPCQGHAFTAGHALAGRVRGRFPFEETPDQATAIDDVKQDMETPTPMDRLLCGDVGFGKTEVAMRAAFKAVMDGKQVAVLVPTTVLALQHLQDLRDALRGVPGAHRDGQPLPHQAGADRVAQGRSREGKVDIVVGTHRLLSKDVDFKDLGLLVVDEEQRFGVTHKETHQADAQEASTC